MTTRTLRCAISCALPALMLTSNGHSLPIDFSDDVRFETGGTTIDITIDDFNNDGTPDVAVVLEEGTVVVMVNDGRGTLTPGNQISLPPAGGPLSSIVSADFNQDGLIDLAAMGSFDSHVFVLINEGDVQFAEPVPLEPPNFTFSSALEAADMDDDGDIDLVLNQPPVVFINAGDGTFGSYASFNGGPVPSIHATGDLDGDTTPDIVSTDFNAGARIIYNDGAHTYTPGPVLAAGPSVVFPLIADLNDDGLNDILVANSIGGIGGDPGLTGRITVLMNEGEGVFAAPTFFEVGDNPRHLDVGDINGDGHVDVVAANSESGTASISLGNGDGTFERDVMFGNDPGRLMLSDMDGDGQQDIVMTAGGLAILFNQSTPVGPQGDLNGDGVVDVFDLLILLGNWG